MKQREKWQEELDDNDIQEFLNIEKDLDEYTDDYFNCRMADWLGFKDFSSACMKYSINHST